MNLRSAIIAWCLLMTCVLCAQEQDFIIVDGYEITGNKKTKEAVILREIPFKTGDTIYLENLVQTLVEGQQQLMNTGLFVAADITYAQWEASTKRVTFNVALKETWYIYPIPIFDLADRNFNVWWKEQNRSLQRINIGMKFRHKNFTGWRDALSVQFKYGYTQSYRVRYNKPYINKKRTLGISSTINHALNRELAYITINNKQEFHRNDSRFIRKRWQVEQKLNWRPAYYARHELGLGYYSNWIDSTIVENLNPDYFSNGTNAQKFFRLSYKFSYDRRDNRDYPWKGYNLGFSVEKYGLGLFNEINAMPVYAHVAKYWPVKERWSFALGLKAKYSLIREQQSYTENKAIGHGSHEMTGYQLYVVDGLDLALLQSNIRFEIWRSDITFGKLIFLEAFKYMPFRVNAIVSNDFGIVNSPYKTPMNELNESMIWGGGLGIDLVLYYDYVFRMQYSYNQFGDTGFFIDFKIGL